jgi:hypothetical protein
MLATGIAYMVMTGACIDNDWELQTVLMVFVEPHGNHTGENLADAMYNVFKKFKICDKVGFSLYLMGLECDEHTQLLVATGNNLTTNNKAMRLNNKAMRLLKPRLYVFISPTSSGRNDAASMCCSHSVIYMYSLSPSAVMVMLLAMLKAPSSLLAARVSSLLAPRQRRWLVVHVHLLRMKVMLMARMVITSCWHLPLRRWSVMTTTRSLKSSRRLARSLKLLMPSHLTIAGQACSFSRYACKDTDCHTST